MPRWCLTRLGIWEGEAGGGWGGQRGDVDCEKEKDGSVGKERGWDRALEQPWCLHGVGMGWWDGFDCECPGTEHDLCCILLLGTALPLPILLTAAGVQGFYVLFCFIDKWHHPSSSPLTFIDVLVF